MKDFESILEFLKALSEISTNKEAFVSAKKLADGKVCIEADGRGIDQMALLLALSEGIIENSPFSVDDYCRILKSGMSEKSKKLDNLDIFSQMFSTVMKDKDEGEL